MHRNLTTVWMSARYADGAVRVQVSVGASRCIAVPVGRLLTAVGDRTLWSGDVNMPGPSCTAGMIHNAMCPVRQTI